MSTETIQIVVAESGAPEAAAGIKSIGTAAADSDAALTDLLARSGTTSAAMQAITSASGTAGAALNAMATGATGATAALLSAGSEASAASARISSVGGAGATAAAGMTAAGTAGTAMVFALREAAAAATAAATGEDAVAVAATAEAAGHARATAAAVTHGAAMHGVGEEAGVLQNKLERLQITFIALGLALGVKELIELTDVYANMSNQLTRVTVDTADYAAKQDDVFRIAQASRQPLEAVNKLYVDMSMALKGMDPVRVSRAIQTLSEAATISGKSVSETSSALQRLGISLRQGEINGRGFLQFLVQMPEVGERVAVALGFTGTNGFKNFVKAANDGEIHTDKFIAALNKIGPAVDTEMKHMEVTVASAFVVVRNAFLDYIGRSDQAVGASRHVAEALLLLADHIHLVIGIIAIITVGLGAYGIAVGLAALATAALSFSFAGIVGLIGVAVTALYFFGNAVKLNADGSVTAFSLVYGAIKTVVEVLGDLIHWMTTTTNGTVVLYGALGTLAVVIGKIAFESILTGLSRFAAVIAVAVPVVLGLIGALALLVVEYLAVRFATIALSQGLDAANKDLDSMKATVLNLADSIGNKLSGNIKDTKGPLADLKGGMDNASESADKMGISIIRGGQGASAQFKSLAKDGSNASVQIVNAMNSAGGSVDKLVTTAQGATNKFDSSMAQMAGGTNQVVDALGRVGAAGANAANQVVNAMGEMVTAESQWAANSGAYFNKVAGEAASTASSISHMQGASSGSSFGSSQSYSAPSSQGFSSGWGISDVSRGSGYGISDLSQQFGKMTFATGGSFEVGGHGGTDSQMVQFMATPGERVTVETPGQQAKSNGNGYGGGAGGDIHLHMTVVTPDANSFRENESQIMLRMQNRLKTVQGRLGGT